MAIAMQRFCINRKIAPALSIEAFFRLVNRLGPVSYTHLTLPTIA